MTLFRYLIFIPAALIVQFAVPIVVYNLQRHFNMLNSSSAFLMHFLASYLGFGVGVRIGPKNKKVYIILIAAYMFLVVGIILQLIRENSLAEGRLVAGILEALGLCCGSWLGFSHFRKGSSELRTGYAISKTDKKFYRTGRTLQWVSGLLGVILFYGDKWLLFVIASAIFLFGRFLEVCSRGNYNFWLKVKNYPNLAYDWFKENDTWLIIDNNSIKDYEKMLSMRDWVGPFHLTVPKLQGETIRIYGRLKELRHSQKKFLTLIQTIEN